MDKKALENSPKLERLKRALQSWLDSLDWDQWWPRLEQHGLEGLPTYNATPLGVPYTFVAIPKPVEQRGQVNVSGVVSAMHEIEMNPVK
jgi:hypothetical protein